MLIQNTIDDLRKKNIDPKDPLAVFRATRLLAKATCRDLAVLLGTKPSIISRIENGEIAVAQDALTAIFMICAYKRVFQKSMDGQPKINGCDLCADLPNGEGEHFCPYCGTFTPTTNKGEEK